MLEVILSCRLILNLRRTHAKAAPSANSNSNSNSNSNWTKSLWSRKLWKPWKLHERKISREKSLPTAPQESEWMDISVANKAMLANYPWPDPSPDTIGEHPVRV
jgi:hypothetical protein